MSISRFANEIVDAHAARRIAEQKAAYRDRIRAICDHFDPPLSNAELSAGLDLRAPAEGSTGASDIGRFVSTSRRLRNARPDTRVRTVIDLILEGTLLIGLAPGLKPEHRRRVLVCERKDLLRMGAEWDMRALKGPPPQRRDEAIGFEDDDEVWDLFADAPPTPIVERPTTRPSRPRMLVDLPVGPVGLGAMRLSTSGRPERAESIALIHRALDHGVRFIDTADSYCLDHTEVGHNEALISEAVRTWQGPAHEVLIASKGGLLRPNGKWVPDARPEHLRAAAEASLTALQVDAIDLYQLHVPDKRVPFVDIIGELSTLRDRGIIRHIGLCNVDLGQLEAARQITEIAAVQVAASLVDRKPFESGLSRYCADNGIALIAHSPLGGHRGSGRLSRSGPLRSVAREGRISVYQAALLWLLDMGDHIMPIPGATRAHSVDEAAHAASMVLSDADRRRLDDAYPWASAARVIPPAPAPEVVVLMGPPASGKTSRVRRYQARGYRRLNRDEEGGRLDDLLPKLRQGIRDGQRHFVLDNTYPSQASRGGVIEIAKSAGIAVRCEHMDTSMAAVRLNVVHRIFERHGELLGPAALTKAARDDPNMLPPAALEAFEGRYQPPALTEGFARIDRIAFTPRRTPGPRDRALILDYDGTLRESIGPAPFPRSAAEVQVLPGRTSVLKAYADAGWPLLGVSNQGAVHSGQLSLEDANATFDRTNSLLGVDIDYRYCPHDWRRSVCWCRKPLPGLGVTLVREYNLDPTACIYVGDRDSDRAFAANMGFAYVDAGAFFADPDAPARTADEWRGLSQ